MPSTAKNTSLNYNPFGSAIESRAFASGEYRYGFNGMEKDNENNSDAYDFGARICDLRLGRWLSLDPLFRIQPSQSAYKSFLNHPLIFIDVEGKTEYQINIVYDKKIGEAFVKVTTANQIKTDGNKHDVPGFFSSATWHEEYFYYDFATITITTIDEKGKKTIETSTEILYENGVKDGDWVITSNAKKGDSKTESLIPKVEEYDFGITLTGDNNASVTPAKAKKYLGDASIDVLNVLIKRPSSPAPRKPGTFTWKKMDGNKSVKDWIKFVNDRSEQGEKIGEVVNKVLAKDKKQDATFECINLGCDFETNDSAAAMQVNEYHTIKRKQVNE